MCVLIIKRAGIELPSDKILKMCHDANSDGCGFSTSTTLFKSLDFESFKRNLKKYVKIEDDCIIHFRLATHGSVKVENCHPFLDKENGVVFAHNGILPIKSKDDMTDSEIYFRKMLIPVIKENGLGEIVDEFIESTIGCSKFAILTKNGVKSYGHFYKTKGCECEFSNLRWDILTSYDIYKRKYSDFYALKY